MWYTCMVANTVTYSYRARLLTSVDEYVRSYSRIGFEKLDKSNVELGRQIPIFPKIWDLGFGIFGIWDLGSSNAKQ